MTDCTIMIKIILHMVGIGDLSEIILMAGITICRSRTITIYMTVDTGGCEVGSGKGKLGDRMVKGCRGPANLVVASQAIMIEIV